MKTLIETIRTNPQTRKFKSVLLPIWLRSQRTALWQRYQKYKYWRQPPRSIQAFCIGLPKTGTHSIAQMLKCRSAHEPEVNILLYLYQQHLEGKMTLDEQIRVLQARDTWLWLELESNWMLGLVIEALVGAFPDAKYILTVRDPLSWMESEINQELDIGHREPFTSAFGYMFEGYQHNKYDQALADYGLHSVAGYLSYWARQNQRILETIPEDKLMVILTQDITPQAQLISEFAGVNGIDQKSTHSYMRSNKKLRLSELVDSSYLFEQINLQTSHVQEAINQRLANSSFPQQQPKSLAD